ncbi:CASP8 protein, partial [Atractosteus spatula]|nr:CASP8 protein [Atractosteus spatula]
MNFTKEMVQEQLQNNNVSRVSPFRKILYEVSQDISSDDLSNMKFLLSDKFGASLENMDIYDIFTAMEKREMLADNNFEELKKIFGQMSPRLLKKIEDYETHNKELAPQILYIHMYLCYLVIDKPLQEESEVVSNLSQMSLCNTTEQEKSPDWFCNLLQNKEYKMSSLPRGYCLILNNFEFVKEGIRKRWGTEHDAKALEEVFSWLGFEVKRHDDLKAAEMRAKLKEYGKDSHEGKDCFVCCVLSHGEQQCVMGTDGEKVEIKDIVSCFNGQNCPSLVQKPKVFFIQACQGKELQKAVNIQADGNDDCEADSQPFSNATVPVDADVLLGLATVQECLSMRNKVDGSWYIQSLCRHLRRCCPRGEDILSILTSVNEEVSTCTGYIKRKEAKQIPEPRHRNTMEIIKENKVFLLEVLSCDPSYILQHVQQSRVITDREYNNIAYSPDNHEKKMTDLLDKVIFKGNEKCQEFLEILQKEDVKETFPKLLHKLVLCICLAQGTEYRMASKPRGYCLIFNNLNFERLSTRTGTNADAKALEEVFSWLGFEVKQYDDLKAAEMRATLEEFGKASHQGKDCFVCCVLSHGEQQCVVGTDGEKVEIKDIVSCFDGKKCPSLVQKPKVFFIQACQGKEFQESVEAQGDGCFPVVRLESDDSGIYRVPVDADVLIGMATVQECLSMRDVRSGTWYIQSLCRQLREGCPRGDDIHSILTKVNEEVRKEEGTIKRIKLAKQIPEPRYTLTKKLVFPVP